MSALCQKISRDATTRQALMGGRLALFAFIGLLLGQANFGCDTIPVVPKEAALRGRIPPQQSVAYGRVLVEGWPKTLLEDSKVRVEFQNLATRERVSYPLEKDGEFSLSLSPGRYAVTSVWSGFQSVEPGKGAMPILFSMPPAALVYLGTLLIRLPSVTTDARGEVIVQDEFGTATETLRKRYPVLVQNTPPLKGLMVAVPAKSMDGVLVDVVLGRRLAALMLVDNDSPYTILTQQIAREFGVRVDQQDPGTNFQAYGGAILSPLMRLKSIRVGDFELQDVEVVVDVDGYFPVGLLGKSVLSHFKVTVDPKKKEARFEH